MTGLVRATNVQDGKLDQLDLTYVSSKLVRPEQLLSVGDIVITMSSGSVAHVGKSAQVPEIEGALTFGAFCGCVRARSVVSDFLFYFLQTESVRKHLSQAAKGTNINNLKREHILSLSIPIPPEATQRRIVAQIEELFAEVDDGEVALTRTQGELETYRKALLKAAVTGELTADWRAASPPAETGSDLLKRILADRREQREGGAKTPKRNTTPLDHQGELAFDFPENWTCAAIGQLGEIVTGSTPATSRPDYYGGDVPFFTPGDLNCESARTTKRTLTEAGANSVRRVPAGSVLVTCIGATIGKLAVAGTAGATNQQINSVVPAKPILTHWIHAFLSSPCGQHEIIDGSSSTTMPILNKGDFSRLPIPVPPLEEIQKICAILSDRLDERHQLSDAVDDLQTEPAGLRQSILAAAFRGDLVQ